MGIAVRTLLAQEFFMKFEVIAGESGLDKEVQGVAIMDAPDALRWTKGKEMIATSGYAIAKEPDCIRRGFEDGSLNKAACMVIKRERHLNQIPQEMRDLFNQNGIPLITMPFEIAWMDLMKEINTIILNRTVRRFQIQKSGAVSFADLSYKDQKIRRILQAVEIEMHFPAFLYDVGEKQSYYSSANFPQITKSFGLIESDYWAPRQEYSRYTLCDHIHMYRIRLANEQQKDGPRVSWILIPIRVSDALLAWFVVMESREFLDYYDEYSIRIAYLMLQNVYEQIVVAQSMGNIGFENFILFALNAEDSDTNSLIYQANQNGLSANSHYLCILFRQTNHTICARKERRAYLQIFCTCEISKNARITFIDENEGLILTEMQAEGWYRTPGRKQELSRLLHAFRDGIREKFEHMDLVFATLEQGFLLPALRKNVEKCQRVMEMGQKLYPEKKLWDDGMVGPLAWLQIPPEELDLLLWDYRDLMQDEKGREFLRTLKVYLENNMNFSVTAEKLYVHINTVRKRIDRVGQLLGIDWDSAMYRLRTEILLQFLNL